MIPLPLLAVNFLFPPFLNSARNYLSPRSFLLKRYDPLKIFQTPPPSFPPSSRNIVWYGMDITSEWI